MNKFKVQEFLETKSLDDLKNELGINCNEYKNLVALNYSQIDSPKMHPVVRECRGIILEKDTWKVISYPFYRFYNYQEVPEINENFDFNNAIGLEKLDGSLISVFNYNSKWLMATRGMIENNSTLYFSNFTFRQLFDKAIESKPFWNSLNKELNYIFELTAPENRVVTLYKTRQLTLLTVQQISDWKELQLDDVKTEAESLNVATPNTVSFKNQDDLLKLAESLATLEEGFVAIDYSKYDNDDLSFKRVKVKNTSYIAIHHLKMNAGSSLRSIIRLVMKNEDDEFIGYFPEFKSYVVDIRKKYEALVKETDEYEAELKEYFGLEKTPENKKAFAMKAKNAKNSAYLFAKYNGKTSSLNDYFDQQTKMKGAKSVEKSLVERLKLKDVEFANLSNM